MGKIERKKKKLTDRIKFLQDELTSSLTKKDSSVEINISLQQRKIQDLKKLLNNL
tara:strand:+ start:63456 stop:63620 length:165 start_codon:yes stop_codon:yes gene_type:complete